MASVYIREMHKRSPPAKQVTWADLSELAGITIPAARREQDAIQVGQLRKQLAEGLRAMPADKVHALEALAHEMVSPYSVLAPSVPFDGALVVEQALETDVGLKKCMDAFAAVSSCFTFAQTARDLQARHDEDDGWIARRWTSACATFPCHIPFPLVEALMRDFGSEPLSSIMLLGVVVVLRNNLHSRGYPSHLADASRDCNTLLHFYEQQEPPKEALEVMRRRGAMLLQTELCDGFQECRVLVQEAVGGGKGVVDACRALHLFFYDQFEQLFVFGCAAVFRAVFRGLPEWSYTLLFGKHWAQPALRRDQAANQFQFFSAVLHASDENPRKDPPFVNSEHYLNRQSLGRRMHTLRWEVLNMCLAVFKAPRMANAGYNVWFPIQGGPPPQPGALEPGDPIPPAEFRSAKARLAELAVQQMALVRQIEEEEKSAKRPRPLMAELEAELARLGLE